jgi:uncharacterized SAM-dependent methyltransferase
MALDISSSMIELAKRNLARSFPDLNTEFHLFDFEGGNFSDLTDALREKTRSNNLLLFLGNTLGNVCDRSRVLTNIRESMTLDDYLLVGIELFHPDRIEEIVGHYEGNRVWQDNIFNALEHFGLSQEDGPFEVKFNKKKSQVEAHFVVEK